MANQQEMTEDDLENIMKNHYNDPNLNAFNVEGLTIQAVKENSRIWLSFPKGIKKHAIHNIMKQFGRVTNINIVDSGKSARPFAFVEFETFKEAEKALREINHSKNSALQFQAQFAHAKTAPITSTVPEQEEICVEEEKEVEESPQITISVKFDDFDDIVGERVSYFNFAAPLETALDENELKYITSCAEKSLGEYNVEKECFEYNMQLRENLLTFYCCECDEEAIIMSDEYRKYFCTKECADIFFNKQSGKTREEEILEYKVSKSDKVCVTAIINEKCLYVRPSDKDLIFLLEMVHKKAKNCQPLKAVPEIDDKILIYLKDTFYRAKITEIYDDDAKVLLTVMLTDIGNLVTVSIDDVYEMTAECMKINSITAKVTLKDVNVEAINMDVIEYLLKLLDNHVELLVKDIDENGVKLMDNETNCNVNEKIVELASFKKVEFDNLMELTVVKGLVDVKDCAQHLFVVNAAYLKEINGIVCVPEKYVKDFHELYRSLNAYGKMIDPKSYGIYGYKALSLIKFNDQWHRGVVSETKGDGRPSCTLIDLQFNCKVKVENIFRLPISLATFPIMSEIYAIDGYETNEEVKKFCDENFIENEFIVADKIQVENGIPIISINVDSKAQ